MNINILKILFLISATRINNQGLVPIICRLTFQGDRKAFSTGLFINPNYWNSKQQKAKPPNDNNTFINSQLSLIKNEINQAFLFLQVNEKTISHQEFIEISQNCIANVLPNHFISEPEIRVSHQIKGRTLNAFDFTKGILQSINGNSDYHWFLS
ncbi:Arm DNA-binding domain-containing protein [Chryseobacterium populi]|uniref:Arm DNA-binding domain-containing protein n=1 Tax=Chryseobacterium populi TaxID=1144316 RepID=J2SWI8_9FLAO|nr:Arm DNA-binding domain-containing protein [Chryseobacterium populi]EJL69977.1 hypothetical protein PMI13_02985 [Chryseobacterium populi]